MEEATGRGSYESGARDEAGLEGSGGGGESSKYIEKNKAGCKKNSEGGADASCCAMMLLDLVATVLLLGNAAPLYAVHPCCADLPGTGLSVSIVPVVSDVRRLPPAAVMLRSSVAVCCGTGSVSFSIVYPSPLSTKPL